MCSRNSLAWGVETNSVVRVSSAPAYVRFADGTIRYAVYDGTNDVLEPALFDTPREAWEHSDRLGDALDMMPEAEWDKLFQPEPCGEWEPVEICADYGDGFWWRGRAAPNVVHEASRRPFGDDNDEPLDYRSGPPSWLEVSPSGWLSSGVSRPPTPLV